MRPLSRTPKGLQGTGNQEDKGNFRQDQVRTQRKREEVKEKTPGIGKHVKVLALL